MYLGVPNNGNATSFFSISAVTLTNISGIFTSPAVVRWTPNMGNHDYSKEGNSRQSISSVFS